MAKRKLPLFEKLLKSANRRFRKAFLKSRPSWGLLKKGVMKMTLFSGLVPWRGRVVSPSYSSHMRAVRVALAAVSLAILAACGGSGGSSFAEDPIGGGTPPPVTPPPVTPPPPDPTGTLVVSPTTCVVTVADTGICSRAVTLSATVQNVTGAVAIRLPNGSTVPIGTNVPVAPPTLGVTEYKLQDGNKTLASASITVSCDSSLIEKDGVCTKSAPPACPEGQVRNEAGDCVVVPPPARIYFNRANLVVSGEVFQDTGNGTLAVGYPQLIEGTKLVSIKNESVSQVGGCMLSSGLLGQEAGVNAGLPSVRCVKPKEGNVRGIFPIDPVGKRLLPEYSGPLPEDMVFYAAPYGTFGDSPYVAQGVSQSGMFIDVPSVGIYYYPDENGNELRFTSDRFLTYEVLQTGQTFMVLTTYTNPAP